MTTDAHDWAVMVRVLLTDDQAEAVNRGGMPRLTVMPHRVMGPPRCRHCAALWPDRRPCPGEPAGGEEWP
jgi:hypothetical protein